MGLSQDKLKFFADYIEKQLGIIYSDTNYFQLEHRLNDITIQLGLKDTEELWHKAKLSIDGQFKALLLDLATNNETSFFRDSHIFQGIEHCLIPELKKKNSFLPSIRFWSAAASTGQEAYSIAMIMDQLKKVYPDTPEYSIFLTDYSERVLNRAKTGKYTQLEVQRGLPAKNLITYFSKSEDNNWTINNTIKSHLSFKQLNLLDNWSFPEDFHVVFCRNVLIYQSVENKKIVVDKIHKSLATGGFLVMGAAESLLGISNQFEQIQYQNAVYYRKI